MRVVQIPAVLKRFLFIFSDLIFDSNVDPGIPNLAAAPVGPDTCPPLSRRAASIISFSWSASFRSEEHTLNSSHRCISYAVFCLKKKKKKKHKKYIIIHKSLIY